MPTKSKNLEIALRPGARLSKHFNNRRNCYKVVEADNVLGYVVLHSTPRGVGAIYPIYTAFIHMKVGKIWHMVASYEQGKRLNEYTFQADFQGCTLATIASQAIVALEARRPARPAVSHKKGSPRG